MPKAEALRHDAKRGLIEHEPVVEETRLFKQVEADSFMEGV